MLSGHFAVNCRIRGNLRNKDETYRGWCEGDKDARCYREKRPQTNVEIASVARALRQVQGLPRRLFFNIIADEGIPLVVAVLRMYWKI